MSLKTIAGNAAKTAANLSCATVTAAKMAHDVAADARKTSAPAAPKEPSRAAGVAQMAAGGALCAIGVPMLVLPGPGVAAIAGGAALAADGARKTFHRKKEHV